MNAVSSGAAANRKFEDSLVQEHAELVRRIAGHVAARLPPSVDVDDLVQAGTVGLIEAGRHYDGERGASFKTYASIRIRGAIVDELRRGDWAPRSVHRRHREISAAVQSVERRTGREAREDEVVRELGITAQAYHAALRDAVQCQVLSLSAPDDDDEDGFDPADTSGGPLDRLEQAEFRRSLAHAIGELPPRERQVLALYYDEELNLREIGAKLEVSESRVCQIHGQALLRLNEQLRAWRSIPPASQRKTRSRAAELAA